MHGSRWTGIPSAGDGDFGHAFCLAGCRNDPAGFTTSMDTSLNRRCWFFSVKGNQRKRYYAYSDQELEDAFAKHGKVRTTKIIRDMFTQQSKGFGFVEMNDKNEANSAIKELNTAELKGKKIVVNEARPQRDRRGGRRR